MRQRMSEKNEAKIRERTGLPVKQVWTRGGWNHAKQILTDDGREFMLRKDGTLEFVGCFTWYRPLTAPYGTDRNP